MENELKAERQKHGSDVPWRTKYSHSTLKAISPDEVARQRQLYDKQKG